MYDVLLNTVIPCVHTVMMNANNEEPTKKFCKAITPTIMAYKKYKSLYSVLRVLIADNDAPALNGEDRVGKWIAITKVGENAQYLSPHILMSEPTWSNLLDTNPIDPWFGTYKKDLSLICVLKFYWKTQAPAVLKKKIVIEYQEGLVTQNAPRGKLTNLKTVRTPQGIFTVGQTNVR